MTVAVPCARCGACFAAGHGHLCPNCRPGGAHPGEVRIPDTRGMPVVPLNDAARVQMGRAPTGETPEQAIKRLFGAP